MTKIYGFPSKGKERTRINKKENDKRKKKRRYYFL